MWTVNGGTVKLDGADVTSAQILEALAKGDDAEIRQDLPDYRFSRIALEPKVQIEGAFPESLTMTPVVAKGAEVIELSNDLDHLTVGKTWHPIQPTTLVYVFDITKGPGTNELSAGDYLKLLAAVDSSLLIDNSGQSRASDWAKVREALPLPDGLEAELPPYQLVGSTALRVLAKYDLGSLLADEMGLGKTIQAIVLMLDQQHRGPSLVIAPASQLPNWRRELAKFAPKLSVLIHSGSSRAGVISRLMGYDVVVTSFESAVNDISILEDHIWNVVVIDEAQAIRNPETQRAKIIKKIPRRISIAVTGTPMENRLTDLWSLSEFVLPQIFGSREQFESSFTDDFELAKLAGRLISPVTVRRRVAEVAQDLPERRDSLMELDPSEELLRGLEDLEEERDEFAALTAKQVMCAHADGSDFDLVVFRTHPKVSYTLSLIEEACANGDKVLVFAGYQNALDRLSVACQNQLPDIFVSVIDGRVEAELRQDIIDAFSEAEEGGVLFLNPKAAGVGLNITAANHVIHFNPEWNPAVTAQATARAYRRRQEKPVFVHHLYYQGTVEEDIINKAEFKKLLAGGVDAGIDLGGEEQ